MASPNDAVPDKGASFTIGSWVFTANGSGGFSSHLADLGALGASATTRCNLVDDFIDLLDEIPSASYVEEILKQPDFEVTSIPCKSPSKLEEDLDQLLEIGRLGVTAV